jgi:hypothetical protein
VRQLARDFSFEAPKPLTGGTLQGTGNDSLQRLGGVGSGFNADRDILVGTGTYGPVFLLAYLVKT